MPLLKKDLLQQFDSQFFIDINFLFILTKRESWGIVAIFLSSVPDHVWILELIDLTYSV